MGYGKWAFILSGVALLGAGTMPGISMAAPPAATAADKADAAAMEKVLGHYSRIQEALASDRLDGINNDASLLIPAARGIKDKKLSSRIQAAAKLLVNSTGKSGTLEKAREDFKKLSGPIAEWVKKNKPAGWSVMYCPMAGASWVQKDGGPVQNPFFGSSMLSCGEKTS